MGPSHIPVADLRGAPGTPPRGKSWIRHCILSIIHTTTIDTMLNFNGGNEGHVLKNVTCKQTLEGDEQ